MPFMTNILFTLIALAASLFAGFEFGKNVFYIFILSFALVIQIVNHISHFISNISDKTSNIVYEIQEIKNTIIDIQSEIDGIRNDLNERNIDISLDDSLATSEFRIIREKLEGISGILSSISGTVQNISYSVS